MVKTYLQFCSTYKRSPHNPSLDTITAYLEYLCQKLASPKSVVNYWATVKLIHARLSFPFDNVDKIEVHLLLRAASLTKRHVSTQKLPFTKQQLLNLAKILDAQGSKGLVVKSAILLGFFGFFRASNLCSENTAQFDPTRHFTRGDIQVKHQSLEVSLKWAKNMQNSLQPKLIYIPSIKPVSIDPVYNYIKMCSAIPASNSSPLFMLPGDIMLTISKLRAIFKLVCQQMSLDPSKYSIHSLRRGGATHAHHQGAQPIDIQRHGAWASQTFWDYVAPMDPTSTTVSSALRT